MNNSSLLNLLKNYLKKYELIEKIDIDNNIDIYSYISNLIHKENYVEDIDFATAIDENGIPNDNFFWRANLTTLIHNFNYDFKILENVNDETNTNILKYSLAFNFTKASFTSLFHRLNIRGFRRRITRV